MPEFTLETNINDLFVSAYITAMFWTNQAEGIDQNDGTLGGFYTIKTEFGVSDLAPSAMLSILADCLSFQAQARELTTRYDGDGNYECAADMIDSDPTQAGHDFWLTRTGSGVSFKDRDDVWPAPIAEELNALAHSFGDCEAYVGDDGLIYLFEDPDFMTQVNRLLVVTSQLFSN